MAGTILKSQVFYRSLVSRNVRLFIFTFFKESFFHEFSKFSLRGRLHRPEDTKCNVLDLADCQNQVHHRKFLSQ